MKRNTLVISAVLLLLSTFAWAGWANFEYRRQAADRMLASVAQGELVLDPAGGAPQYVTPLKGKPAPPWASELQKDSAGYLTLSTDAIIHDFAQDLPVSQARLVAATQGPWFAGCTDDKVTEAAWHNKPSWWVLTEKDRMIPPALQAAMAQQIGATVVKVDASHVAMLSKPAEVAAAIIAAARAAQ